MLNRFPGQTPTHTHTHVVNYNYAILISKQASEKRRKGSMSKSCSDPWRVVALVLASSRWKGEKWWMKCDDFQLPSNPQQTGWVGHLTLLNTSHHPPPPTFSFDWAYPVGLERGVGPGLLSVVARPANRELLAFMILIEADVYWQLNNDSTTQTHSTPFLCHCPESSNRGRTVFWGKSSSWAFCLREPLEPLIGIYWWFWPQIDMHKWAEDNFRGFHVD